MKDRTLTKTRKGTRVDENSQVSLDTLSKGSLFVMGGISALIGLWAAISFVSALVGSGGPLALVRSWFEAVIGM